MPGYSTVATDCMGELGCFLALSEGLEESVARRAAEGWGGDVFRVLKGRSGGLALLWHTEWDTAKEAEEFEQSWARRTLERFPGSHEGRTSVPGRRGIRLSEDKVSLIARTGPQVLIAEGLSPGSAEAAILGMRETDSVSIPEPRRLRSDFRGLATPLRILFDVERFDQSTRVTVLRGLLLNAERAEASSRARILGGALLDARSAADGGSFGLLGHLLQVDAHHQGKLFRMEVWPFLTVGGAPGTANLSLGSGLLAFARRPGGWVLNLGVVGMGGGGTVRVDESGEGEDGDEASRSGFLLFGLVHF